MRLPYYRVKRGNGFWEPTREMREAGLEALACGPDGPEAWAKAKAQIDRWNAIKRGGDPRAQPLAPPGSLDEAFRRYRSTAEWSGKAPRTREEWDRAWSRIAPVFGPCSPRAVTLEHISAFRAKVERDVSTREAHRCLKIWRALWRVAAAQGYCERDADPSLGERNKEPARRQALWSHSDARALVKAAWRSGYRGLAAIIAVAWDSSLSPVDVRGLTPAQRAKDDHGEVFLVSRAKTGRAAAATITGDEDQKIYKTYSYRVKDARAAKALASFAFGVNQVWNHCCASGRHSVRHNQRRLTKAQLYASTKGSSKELGINSQTVQAVVETYYDKRKAARRPFLRWRKSGGVRRSLGWVPFKNQTVSIEGAKVTYSGKSFYLWKHREMEGRFVSGSFAQDARGRWYANFVCAIEPSTTNRTAVVGIDLGLKTAAHGVIVEQGGGVRDAILEQSRFYRDVEPRLAEAQRKGRKRQVKTLHAKIANRRKDALHKYSRQIVDQAGHIFIGNVSSSFAIATAAKSALDVSWATLRNLVKYKSDHAGVVCEETNEAWSTQACSACGSISGPKGREGLEIRRWACSDCGTEHDRDGNAALNIARFGCETLGLKWPGSPRL